MVCHIQEPLYGNDNYFTCYGPGGDVNLVQKAEVTADSLGLYGCIWLCIMRMP